MAWADSQAALVSRALEQVLVELRPDAVALVDSFELPDYFLNSGG